AGFDSRDPTSYRCTAPDYNKSLDGNIRGLRIGVVQHWGEELRVGQEARQAMERALNLLSDLGAELEEVRLRPLQDYYDVRIIISEAELLSVHQKDLVGDDRQTGQEFVGRLSACLYQAVDYVQAQRLRSTILAEMPAIYRSYDALVTASSAPAPSFDVECTADEWIRLNAYIYTPFNVTGGPALSICNGFTSDGLPLGMQIAGRPFDETTILRIGHAYQQASVWHLKRPNVVAPPNPLRHGPRIGVVNPLPTDPVLLRQLSMFAARAGLNLSQFELEKLYGPAQQALERTRRIGCNFDLSCEPATLTRLFAPEWS
ncbi:MAG: hypothetical protein KIT18_06180, partial [Burkholderiales bacterium]|nr:hypothetical protein [Burkholderiales bacterium]